MIAHWQRFVFWLSHRLWLAGYWLEDKRIESAAMRQLASEAACCLGLLLHRMVDRLARGVI